MFPRRMKFSSSSRCRRVDASRPCIVRSSASAAASSGFSSGPSIASTSSALTAPAPRVVRTPAGGSMRAASPPLRNPFCIGLRAASSSARNAPGDSSAARSALSLLPGGANPSCSKLIDTGSVPGGRSTSISTASASPARGDPSRGGSAEALETAVDSSALGDANGVLLVSNANSCFARSRNHLARNFTGLAGFTAAMSWAASAKRGNTTFSMYSASALLLEVLPALLASSGKSGTVGLAISAAPVTFRIFLARAIALAIRSCIDGSGCEMSASLTPPLSRMTDAMSLGLRDETVTEPLQPTANRIASKPALAIRLMPRAGYSFLFGNLTTSNFKVKSPVCACR